MPKKQEDEITDEYEDDEDIYEDEEENIDELEQNTIETPDVDTKEEDDDQRDEPEYNLSEYTTMSNNDKSEELKGSMRITRNTLTKYEMVRILGERTKQLTMGAKPMVKNYLGIPYDVIAVEELKLGTLPFKIKRTLPNGKYEYWCVNELNLDHLLQQLE